MAFRLRTEAEPEIQAVTWQFPKSDAWPDGVRLDGKAGRGTLWLGGQVYEVADVSPVFEGKTGPAITAVGYRFTICRCDDAGVGLTSAWELGLSEEVTVSAAVTNGAGKTNIGPTCSAKSWSELQNTVSGRLFLGFFEGND